MTATPESLAEAVSPDRAARLAANLGQLFAADLTLARALDGLPDSALPPLIPARRAGAYTAAVTDAAGAMLYLHSRHDPVDEAKRAVDAAVGEARGASEGAKGGGVGGLDGKVCVVMHGVGLGYGLAEVLGRTSKDVMVLVFEEDLAVLRRALECVDLVPAIKTGQVAFVTRAEKATLFAAVGARTVMLSMGMATVNHAPSRRLRPAFHDECAKLLSDHIAFARTSLNTLVLNGRKTAENITKNVGWYAACGGLSRLRDRHKGRPALIVSAGPSLRKNRHLLPQAKGRAVMIAVQTTLKPLVEMGVAPEYVTSLDYHDISARFFENLPAGLATELVAEPKVTDKVLGAYRGPVTVTGNDFADALLREMRLDRPALRAGATVAHLSFYLARFMGCDPILFVGQDLGFSDGLTYLPGTSYDEVWRPELGRFCSMDMKQWEQIVRERPILRRIPATGGGTMYTEERLFTYLQQFERDFAEAAAEGVRVFDCTEGGALKRGAEAMTLSAALERFCGETLPEAVRDARPVDRSRTPEVAACLKRRRAEAEAIGEIAKQTLPLLEEIRDHLRDQTRVNRAIARIDLLRVRMNELGQTYDLVTQLTQESELQRFENDLAMSAAKDADPLAKQRMQVERDVINCRAIGVAGREFAAMMSGTIDALAAFGAEGAPTADRAGERGAA